MQGNFCAPFVFFPVSPEDFCPLLFSLSHQHWQQMWGPHRQITTESAWAGLGTSEGKVHKEQNPAPPAQVTVPWCVVVRSAGPQGEVQCLQNTLREHGTPAPHRVPLLDSFTLFPFLLGFPIMDAAHRAGEARD
jgi:hypothetical protein